jgi:hypothetical protein
MAQNIVFNSSNTVCAVHDLGDGEVFVPYDGYTCVPFSGTAEIGWTWDGTQAVPPVLTLEQAKDTIQARLDNVALSWGYYDMKSAVSYIGDPNPKYNAEGTVLRDFRSATWTTAEELVASAQPPKTIDELIAALPPIPTRPTVPAKSA